MFQKTIIKFLKLMKLRQRQQPKRGLIKLLPFLFKELGWHVLAQDSACNTDKTT